MSVALILVLCAVGALLVWKGMDRGTASNLGRLLVLLVLVVLVMAILAYKAVSG
jgi:hypothetical protein